MKKKQETFASLIQQFGGHRDLRTIFKDFLKLSICAFSRNYETNLSYLEDEYIEIISKYKKPIETDLFSALLATLIVEMEQGGIMHDVLGGYFERNISNGRNGQYFTPEPVCQFMASVSGVEDELEDSTEPLHILDPACGSGRMLLASAKVQGKHHYFYGIDIDETCVEMTILNLFLNGIFNAEVMQANALARNDFIVSYRTSFVPLGIHRITEKEKSRLWHMHQNSFPKAKEKQPIFTPSIQVSTDRGEQMNLF